MDDNNTDSTYEVGGAQGNFVWPFGCLITVLQKNSKFVQVIEEHLGHIPGLAMEVHFDGMGPTYTEVIRKGWQLFPEVRPFLASLLFRLGKTVNIS